MGSIGKLALLSLFLLYSLPISSVPPAGRVLYCLRPFPCLFGILLHPSELYLLLNSFLLLLQGLAQIPPLLKEAPLDPPGALCVFLAFPCQCPSESPCSQRSGLPGSPLHAQDTTDAQ